ncbi:TVP38/TMEM64 family protein [Planomicrobium okeanokoites]|nr:VTT domain-containing protein [Planomicrobium okeanokoites]
MGAVGFFPSFLLTALNISSFGLTLGTILSLSGEIFGAVLGFHLYRFGFAKINPKWLKRSFWRCIQSSSISRVFWVIILLRLVPFVPSGLVTAGAALTPIPGGLFMIASTIGKIPAVSLEVAVVYGLVESIPPGYQYGLFILILLSFLLIWAKNKRKNSL